MSNYRRYERYKGSGVEWIGEIPVEWEVKKLKHISNITMGQSPKSEECSLDEIGLPFLQGNAEFTSSHPIPKMYCNTANKFSKINDILLSVRAPVGAMNISDRVYGIGRGLCAVTANKVQVRYLWYSMNVSLEELFIKSKGSTFEAVTVTDVNNLLSILPPKKEQIAIANFLDQKTTEIDGLIDDKEKLIELLQEKRQAIISEAVTKGLNPNVRMKDSGIEWIGEIPEHWAVKPLFTLLTERKVRNAGNKEKNVLSLSYGRIIRRDVESNFGLLPESFETYQIVEPGNIILRLTDLQNDHRSLRCGLVTELGIITSAYIALESNKTIDEVYVYNLLHAYDLLKVFYGMGDGVRQSMSYKDLKWMPIIFPPIHEQREICNYLSTEIDEIDNLIIEVKIEAQKLKEYRQSIISEAVTGKIDVREFENMSEVIYE